VIKDGARIAHTRRSSARRPALLVALATAGLLAASGLLVGCGSAASHSPSNRELALQRAQFARIAGELQAVEGAVQREVSASRRVWPLIAAGLPSTFSPSLRSAVARATASAKAIREPRFMANASRLTGPAAGIAGLYESYERLTERGWRLTAAGIAAITAGAPTVANFARKNSALYIDAIYDAHFNLSLLGKSVVNGYERLGGPHAFGAALTSGEVSALTSAYSIPGVQLQPHPSRVVAEG
jgi:hypothetical protein